MLRLLSVIAAISYIGLWQAAFAAEPAPRVNCALPFQRDMDLAPIGAGPLQLTTVYCQPIRSTNFSKSAAVVSPDARSVAYMEHGENLRVALLDGGNVWTGYPTEMGVFAEFDTTARSLPAFSWSSDAKFLWSARGKLRPGGFATSPLQPLKAVEDRGIELLPPLQHDNGPARWSALGGR